MKMIVELLRYGLKQLIELLASALNAADLYEHSYERISHHNGYRPPAPNHPGRGSEASVQESLL